MSKFAESQIRENHPRIEECMSVRTRRMRPHREHAIQTVAPDEGLWGSSVKERYATKRREGICSAVNHDLCGEKGVVERNDAADETGAVF